MINWNPGVLYKGFIDSGHYFDFITHVKKISNKRDFDILTGMIWK